MNHDEQSDLGPYCLQCMLNQSIIRREEQTTKVVTGRLRVNTSKGILTVSQNRDSADRSVQLLIDPRAYNQSIFKFKLVQNVA